MNVWWLAPVILLSGCQSVTIEAPDGTRIKSVNTGDFGNVAIRDATGSGGGLNSIITGDVSTRRSTAFQEAAPGYMRTTTPGGVTVEFGGTINNSVAVSRHWDGATSMLRNWVARLVAGDLFDAFNTRTLEDNKTDRNRTDNSTRAIINSSNNETRRARINARD